MRAVQKGPLSRPQCLLIRKARTYPATPGRPSPDDLPQCQPLSRIPGIPGTFGAISARGRPQLCGARRVSH